MALAPVLGDLGLGEEGVTYMSLAPVSAISVSDMARQGRGGSTARRRS